MASSKFSIQKVVDNKEKGVSYKENFKRYNKAKSSEFYLECLWILYAMIEDRTSSFLYYIGFTSEKNRSSVTGTKKIKKEIREILGMEQPNAKYKFDTISGKFTRIKELLVWSKMEHERLSDYKQALAKALQPVADSLEFENALNYLESEWRDKRNQLTHSLFNKNPDAVLAELLPLVENGYTAARQLDAGIREIKKSGIRLKFKIQ